MTVTLSTAPEGLKKCLWLWHLMPGCSLLGETFLTWLRLRSNMPSSSPTWKPFSFHLGYALCILHTLLAMCGTSHPVLGCPPPHGRPGDSSWTVTPRRHRPSIISRQTHPTLGCHSPLPHANSCSPGVWVQCWSLSHVWLFATPCDPYSPPGSSVHSGVGCRFLFQGIFPTQGSNLGLLHCRQILYPLSYQWSPKLWNKIFRIGREWEGEKLLVF